MSARLQSRRIGQASGGLAPAMLLAAVLGCGGTEPPPPPATSATEASPAASRSASAADTAAELQRAWGRVDALLDHVVGWSLRDPLLAGLDERAITKEGPSERRLSYRRGVTDFVPDPDCDPERAKCGSVPTWGKDGGLVLELRAHHQAHAAGSFDAMHEIGPLTLEVRLDASSPGLRTALLRELSILAGDPEPPPAGCPGIVEQATPWVLDDQHRRDIKGVERVRVELEQLEPARDLVDLDADGTPELVLVHRDTGRNAEHFIYHERDGCLRLVGLVEHWTENEIYCKRVPERSLCDLQVSRISIHDDQSRFTWQFDGTRYVEPPS
jgi:hypothetical protein